MLENDNAFQTTLLLREYRRLDQRFAVLTVAFRIWARICQLDQPDLGTLPAHAYSLLVLYFMQQHGILPVLHNLKCTKEVSQVICEDNGDAADVVVTSPTNNIDDTFLSN